MNSYASLCDDFGMSVYLHSKLEMPSNRETVLHFFEAVQKAVPKLTEFEKRESGEYTLEDADQHHQRVLEMAPYHLDLSGLQTESLDVLYYFDFLYTGNHDEVVA